MITILQFTDILCVWAYIAQVRADELREHFGADIHIEQHFCSVFGDTQRKITKGWAERGGFAGYGDHVKKTVGRFDHVEVHPDIWTRDTPRSSLATHLFLNAVRLAEPERFDKAVWTLRQAFFHDLVDISNRDEQLRIAELLDMSIPNIELALKSGAAHAGLDHDLKLAARWDVKVSPTFIFNEGRQRLVGNVGYRILEANVHELLHRDDHAEEQLSWC